MDEKYKVYIKTDNQNNIIDIGGGLYPPIDLTNWTEIDEGIEYPKYVHPSGNYLDKPIMTDTGIYRYKYVDGEVIEKTPEEIATEEANLPPPEPSMEADILSMTLDHEYRLIMIELGGL